MYTSKISGTGHFVPDQIYTNEYMTTLFETSDQWITERTGIKERRIADPEKNEYPSTMAAQASEMAIKKAGIDKNDIGMILFSSTMSDYNFPNSATLLQDLLGIENKCACIDLNAACTGWLYSLVMANSLIETGIYENILIVGSETTSSYNNWKDRSKSVLFGDGCGAIILSRSDNANSKIHKSVLASDSSKKDDLIKRTGMARSPFFVNHESLEMVEMNGTVVFKSAVKTMASQCASILEQTNTLKEDIDLFIPHQANLRIIEAVAHRFEFPKEKVFINVQKYANTSSASIPLALSEALEAGKLKRGDKLLLTAFGSGLTSGTVLLTY